MKKFLIVFSLFLSTFVFAKEHVILQFDVNQTLIGTDKATDKKIEDVINHSLAKQYCAKWDETVEEPMNYADYVYEVKVPGARGDNLLKKRRTQLMNQFVAFAKEFEHPEIEEIIGVYQEALDQLQKVDVLPSFFRFIEYLENEGYTYQCILRSFGHELQTARKAIEENSNIRFSDERLNLIRGELYTSKRLDPLKEPMAIYHHLKEAGHVSIQDNWKEWQNHDQQYSWGKRIFLDREDHHVINLFFDDHLEKPSKPYNVGCGIDIHSGEVLPIEELFETCFFKVDFLEALFNENYFIEKFQIALQTNN